MQHQRRYYLFFSWVLLLSNIAIAQTSVRFQIDLEPADPSSWQTWRPVNESNVSFTATVTGTTDRITAIAYTFTLSDLSNWQGTCMNKDDGSDAGSV